MMNAVYNDIPRIYTAFAECGACISYLFVLPKRFSKSITAFISLIFLAVQSLFLIVTGELESVLWILCMLLAVIFMYLFLQFTCRIKYMETAYCCAKAFLLAEFAASLEWQLNVYVSEKSGYGIWLDIFLMTVIYGLSFAFMILIEKKAFSKGYLEQVTHYEMTSSLLIALLTFVLSNLSFVVENIPFTGSTQSDIFNIRTLVDIVGIAILYAFQSRICEYMAEREALSMNLLLKIQYEQYKNYLENIENIQIIYHDLKHQIASLKAEMDEEKRKKWIQSIEKELTENEIVEKTGNSVLDTILYGKRQVCRKNNIQITCVVDGRLLDFLHVTDICAIFGNALDNAIENALKQERQEERLIHVSVLSRNQFILVQVRNYYGRDMDWKKGEMPITTKMDYKHHGFGLKSILRAVKKYDGVMTVEVNQGWFELRILFPVEGTCSLCQK